MGIYVEKNLPESGLPSDRRLRILEGLVDTHLWGMFLNEDDDYHDSLEFRDTSGESDEKWKEKEFGFKTELEELQVLEAGKRRKYQKLFSDNEGRVVRVVTWEDMSIDSSEGMQLGVMEYRDYFYSEGMMAEVVSDNKGRIMEKNFYVLEYTYKMWDQGKWPDWALIAFKLDVFSGVVEAVRVNTGWVANDEWVVDDDFLYVRQDYVKDWRELGEYSSWNPGFELSSYRSERNMSGVRYLNGTVDSRLMIENNQLRLRVYKDIDKGGMIITSKFFEVGDVEVMEPMLGVAKPRMFEMTKWEALHCELAVTVKLTKMGDIFIGNVVRSGKRFRAELQTGNDKKDCQELLGGEFDHVVLARHQGKKGDEYLVIGINGRGEVEGFVEV